MTPEAEAIVGLFAYIWSHESEHSYDRHGGSVRLGVWVFKTIVAMILLIHAALRGSGLVS